MTTITLSAPSGTDIWRKPSDPSPAFVSHFSAPTSHFQFVRASIFKSARATIRGNWTRLYDQAGILLTFNDDEGPPAPPGPPQPLVDDNAGNPYTTDNPPKRWIKTGIEYVDNAPYISTVACDRWADWSVLPNPSGAGNDSVEIEVKRDKSSLWVYVILDGGEKRLFIRKVTWAFEDAGHKMGIGLYACRPTKKTAQEDGEDVEMLEVKFEGWKVETELV